jgi:ankyrin repeat protein
MVSKAFELGVSLAVQDKLGQTAFHIAAQRGVSANAILAVFFFLLLYFSNMAHLSPKFATDCCPFPLCLFVCFAHVTPGREQSPAVVHYILEHDPSVLEIKDSNGKTALELAEARWLDAVTQIIHAKKASLLAAGVDVAEMR